MRSVLGLALAAACSPAAGTDVTGYVVDKLCWDRDGHVGVDGTKMGTEPETHRIYCMLLSSKIGKPDCDKGYIMLRSLTEPDANNYTYAKAYSLDSEQGTQAVIDVLHKEFARTGTTFEKLKDMAAGSRRLKEQFTVTGEVSGETLNVKKICLTPMVQNDKNEQVCVSTARGGNVTTSTSSAVRFGFLWPLFLAAWGLLTR